VGKRDFNSYETQKLLIVLKEQGWPGEYLEYTCLLLHSTISTFHRSLLEVRYCVRWTSVQTQLRLSSSALKRLADALLWSTSILSDTVKMTTDCSLPCTLIFTQRRSRQVSCTCYKRCLTWTIKAAGGRGKVQHAGKDEFRCSWCALTLTPESNPNSGEHWKFAKKYSDSLM